MILCIFYSTNIVFSETSNNPTTKSQDNDNNEDTTNSLLTTIGIVIPALLTLYLGFRQYRKEKEKQLLEFKNKREFEYDVKLREQRIIVYENLWELTNIDFDENSSKYKIEYHKSGLTKWYYRKGQGMFLTESSQKLFHNYKNALENLEKDWNKMVHCDKCKIKEEERGKCTTDLCKEGHCKYCEIKFLKDMTSGFRTNLLKDIGTRGELKEPSPYYDIYIKKENQIIKKNSVHPQTINFTFFFIGSQRKELQDKVVFIIRNIDNNRPEFIEEKIINELYPGQKFIFMYDLRNLDGEWLQTGNYSIKIVADSIYNEDSFQIGNINGIMKIRFEKRPEVKEIESCFEFLDVDQFKLLTEKLKSAEGLTIKKNGKDITLKSFEDIYSALHSLTTISELSSEILEILKKAGIPEPNDFNGLVDCISEVIGIAVAS